MLAVPVRDLSRLRYPLLASPKLDGMRLSITQRGPVTRGGGLLANEAFRKHLTRPELVGLDGELIFGDPVADGVVQRSIAAGNARNGPPPHAGLTFFVFDSFADSRAPFVERYAAAERAVKRAKISDVAMVPQFPVDDAADLVRVEARILRMRFEGVVLRDPNAPYVFGRVDPNGQTLLKLKRREEMIGDIVDVVERRGRLEALMVAHPEWAEPFSLELHRLSGKLAPDVIGRRVRFSRLPGSWRRAPRAPLFVALEDRATSKSEGAGSMAKKRTAAKRELIDTGRDKRFVRRTSKGRFEESDDVGRSLATDRRKKAKTAAKRGQGDKGDRPKKKK